MKMRELERRTGVTRQMVQFYLAHGLLPEPVRPKPNVAEYSEEHVRAIEAIRRLQTEGRLKINEIKQALNGSAAALRNDVASLPHLDTLFALRTGVDTQLVALDSLETQSPMAQTDAKVLQEIGAIQIHQRNGRAFLSRMDAQVVGLWGEARAAGYTEARGFDATTVGMYLKAARELAFAEIELFQNRIEADLPVEERAAMAEAGSRIMLSVFTVLRMKAEFEAFQQAEKRTGDPRRSADPRRQVNRAAA
ncbi:MerR family transcriptional regulator [Panacagrimonas sp.]|uniref:MerR family transcriptional regulator n=1 Tax=Panacagrimonas sp. TaxID=2480088 RepID=UPI003B51B5C5